MKKTDTASPTTPKERLLFPSFGGGRGVFLFLLLLLSSCTKTVYVPVESVRTEYKNELFRDSVYVSDSVIIRTKADTVWYEKYKIYYQDRLLRDSIIVTDSVQVPYPVEVVKEVNKLKWWQRALMGCGVVFCVFLAVFTGSKTRK